MAKPPKLANIDTVGDFSHWLADTVQRASASENAGFVQIVRDEPNRTFNTERLHVSTGAASFVIRVMEEGSEDAA